MRFFIGIYLTMSGLLFAQPGSVPAGTMVQAKLETAVKTASSEVGDIVVAVLTKPVVAADKIMVPGGSRLHGRVETIQHATRTNEGRVRLVFREIQLPDGKRVSTWITNAFVASAPKRAARYVAYMGLGAAAGAVIGGKNGRVAGVIGGTLTGFVIAGNTGGPMLRDLTLKEGQQIRLQLGEDLNLAE
ncbi:MAG TPA: TrbI/VirB10 family protein [Terriglobia bacterium]|nr:TrbI/VirB10 family protein [Terriglobia bacterium]